MRTLPPVCAALMAALVAAQADGVKPDMNEWLETCRVADAKTHVVPRTWHLDKYPDAPRLTPRAKVTLLDVDGPGVVTLLHASDYHGGDASRILLRVWYDGDEVPAIEMPLMDFLGDIQAAARPYHTVYFSRVHGSHNFRLPMPFRRHIRIEIENPAERTLMGCSEVQWNELEAMPAEAGYLRVSYLQGTLQFPREDLTLCDIRAPGAIVAHWLQVEGDHPACAGGQGTCEGNHEIHLDGDTEPTGESLGVEDFYGHSWGFGTLGGDSYCAIVRADPTPKGGMVAAMVRTRVTDKIVFRASCRIVLTYRHDLGEPFNPQTDKGKAPALQPFVRGESLAVPYRSCVYYYTPEPAH
jgi:hypothetical protein